MLTTLWTLIILPKYTILFGMLTIVYAVLLVFQWYQSFNLNQSMKECIKSHFSALKKSDTTDTTDTTDLNQTVEPSISILESLSRMSWGLTSLTPIVFYSIFTAFFGLLTFASMWFTSK